VTDLLLAHGYFLSEDEQERRIMKPYSPLGLLYVASHLAARGFGVSVFDSTFRGFADFETTLLRDRPSVVGLYCNLMTKRNVLRMAAAARAQGAVVVLGGPDPPHYAEAYLEHGADFVVIGEGELTLEELLPRLLKRPGSRDLADVRGIVYRDESGAVVKTPPRPLLPKLDDQPWPLREAIELEPYLAAWRGRHGKGSLSLLTARGCPFTCRWCSRSVFGESHRRRSAVAVADELQFLVERYRPDMVWYADDVFTIHKGFVLDYARELERRGLTVPFECISRADRIDEEVADALARLSCSRLWIGSESGSQRILDLMDRRVSVEQVRHATSLLKQRGIETGMFIMLGYEDERLEDLEATVEHLKRAAPDVFLTTVAYPIKGTEYYERALPGIVNGRPFAARSDRDLGIAGRHSRRYYGFVRQWMDGEVSRDRHWRAGRYVKAARAAARAGVGRFGMALASGEKEGAPA
jgi:radical SAM superfamily enzyme YgiQ (UPF0313 family)